MRYQASKWVAALKLSTSVAILFGLIWLISSKNLQHNTSISATDSTTVSANCNAPTTGIFVPTTVVYVANISSSPYIPPNTCIGNINVTGHIYPGTTSVAGGCGFVGGGRIDIGGKHPTIKTTGAQCKGSNQITKWHMWGDGTDDANFDCSAVSLFLAGSYDNTKNWTSKTAGDPFLVFDPGGGEAGTGPFTDGTTSDRDNQNNGEVVISGLSAAANPTNGGIWHICNFDLDSGGPYQETATIMLDTN